jgi:hypothetical protein
MKSILIPPCPFCPPTDALHEIRVRYEGFTESYRICKTLFQDSVATITIETAFDHQCAFVTRAKMFCDFLSFLIIEHSIPFLTVVHIILFSPQIFNLKRFITTRASVRSLGCAACYSGVICQVLRLDNTYKASATVAWND